MADGRPTAIDPKGIIRNQTKIGVEDGTMHDLINLRFKDGSWRTSGDGKRVTSFINIAGGKEYKQLYVHVGPKYKHLLGVRDGYLYWFANIDNNGQKFTPVAETKLTAISGDMYINQTGHIITIIDGEDNFEYFVFKMDVTKSAGGYYKQIKVDENGSISAREIWPFGRAHFNLYSPMEKDYYFSNIKNGIEGNLPSLGNTRYWNSIGDLDIKNLQEDGFLSKERWQNIMVATWAKVTEANKFTNPFLACVACELYDGSWVLASNPVLLWPHDSLADNRRSYDINPRTMNLTKKVSQDSAGMTYEYGSYGTNIIPASTPFIEKYRFPRAFIPQGMIIPQNLGFALKENGEIYTPPDGFASANVIVKNVPVCIENVNRDDITIQNKTLRRPHMIKGTDTPVMCFGASGFYRIRTIGILYYTEGYAPKCEICGSDLTLSLTNTSFLKDNSDVFKSIGVFITKPADIYNMEADYTGGSVVYGVDMSYEGNNKPSRDCIVNMGYIPKERGRDEIEYDLMHSPFYLLRKYTKESISELISDPRVKLTAVEYKKKLKNITQETNKLEIESSSRMTYLPKVVYSYNNRMHIANYKAHQFHGYPLDMFQLHNHLVTIRTGSYMKGFLPNLSLDPDEAHRQYPKKSLYYLSSTTPSISTLVDKLTNENKAFAFVKVWLNTENGEQIVTRYIAPYDSRISPDGSDPNFIEDLNPLLTFPDSRAFKMRIMIFHTEVNPNYVCWWDREFDLKPHPLMNMAYYMKKGNAPIPIGSTPEHWNYVKRYSTGDTKVTVAEYLQGLNYTNLPLIPAEQNNIEYYPNGLKVSKVNNPLYFPVENTYGVGQSSILALMSNTMPVGTGQTGAAPLYVFCQDGIYALFVDASGEMAYPNSRILSRDVLSIPRSVTPIDNGVVFVTERGLMNIAGFEVHEIGQPAEGDVEILTQPASGEWNVAKKFIFNRATLKKIGNLPASLFDGVDFLTYLNDKRNDKETLINYNHNDRELMVSNPNYPYTYVMDRFGQWSRRDYTADQYVNNFPTSYRVKDGVFYKVDDEGEYNPAAAVQVAQSEVNNSFFALSNPMKLGSIGFKEAHRFVVRGEFETDMFKTFIDDEAIDHYQPLGSTPIYKTINLPATVDGQRWDEQNIELIDPIDFTIPENSWLHNRTRIGSLSHYAFNGKITVTLADADCVFRNSIRNRVVPKMSVQLAITNRDTDEIVFSKLYTDWQLSEDLKSVTLDLSDNGSLPSGFNIPSGNYRFSLIMEDVSLRQTYTKDEEVIYTLVTGQIPTISFGDTEVVKDGNDELVTDYQITETYPLHIPLITQYFEFHDAEEVKGKISGKLLFKPTVDGEIEDAVFKRPPRGASITMTYGLKLSKYDAINDTYVTVFNVPEIPMFLDDFFDEDLLTVDFDDFIDFSSGNQRMSDILNNLLSEVTWEDGAKYKFELYHEDSNLYLHLQDSYEYQENSFIQVSAGNGSNATIEIFSKKVNTPNYKFIIDTNLDYESSDDSDDSSTEEAGYEIEDFYAQLYTENHVIEQPSKLGCYIFGSYDGRKWALLGGNERTGDFTDIGCLVERTDMKFFRVCLAGQLKGNSRIDYMEISTEPSVLNTKIR